MNVRSGVWACNGRDTFRIAVNAGQLNVSSERRNNSGLAYGHSFILVYCQLRGNKHRWNTQRRAINLPVALPCLSLTVCPSTFIPPTLLLLNNDSMMHRHLYRRSLASRVSVTRVATVLQEYVDR